jgi:hypothetical protein
MSFFDNVLKLTADAKTKLENKKQLELSQLQVFIDKQIKIFESDIRSSASKGMDNVFLCLDTQSIPEHLLSKVFAGVWKHFDKPPFFQVADGNSHRHDRYCMWISWRT